MAFLDDYEPVEDRLAKFWADHPDGQVITEMVPAPEGQWIVKASVWRTGALYAVALKLTEQDFSDMRIIAARPDATGLAHEHVTTSGVNKTSALENCETSAIGRALANLGYAAKGKRPSREEMEKVERSKLTREDPEVDPKKWLADAVGAFGLWTPEERKAAGADAMKELGLKNPLKLEGAQAVFEKMSAAYYLAHPEALPF